MAALNHVGATLSGKFRDSQSLRTNLVWRTVAKNGPPAGNRIRDPENAV